MYTVVPRQGVIEHRPRPGEPALEIIDHREQPPQSLTSKKKRQEQLPYETLKTQRDSLFQKELKYKKRIEDLEKDSATLLKTYENTYEENVKLKRILDSGPDATKMKQLSKDKKEQKGIIDELKDENQALAEKISELEKEVFNEKLKANDRSWDKQLAKVKKKREEEDAIPTEGPFVGGKITKPKKLVLLDEDGPRELDAYDLQVDSLEKETQVLLNKVKILKREKEQIDYAMLMGKGAVTKNKTVSKAINDKLNRDLNKFVIRLQMLKMKQNAARTYCTLMTDESNPVIQLKDVKSGQVSPDDSARESRSRRSWKRQRPGYITPMVENSKSNTEVSNSKLRGTRRKKGGNASSLSGRISDNKEKKRESDVKKKPRSITARENNGNNSVATHAPKLKVDQQGSDTDSKQQKKAISKEAEPKRLDSADIWERVQSSKLPQAMKHKDSKLDKSNNAKRRNDSQNDRNNTPHRHMRGKGSDKDTPKQTTEVLEQKANNSIRHRPSSNEKLSYQTNNSGKLVESAEVLEQKVIKGIRHRPSSNERLSNQANNSGKPVDSKTKPVSNAKQLDQDKKAAQRTVKSSKTDADATGRYTHGPEPIGRKGLIEKKSAKSNVKQDASIPPNSIFSRNPQLMPKTGLKGAISHEDLSYRGTQGHMYRINGPDDGYSLVRLQDHVARADRGMRARPVPIQFKTKKSYDVKENKSIIGNTGIRKDAFYRQLNDEDPYYGM